ncbi:MAG: KilA-N domain-containing protein [Anaerolineaceae bacterium]|nr:KilA-N domain-containing protein [Anaerolineaceae bacterium]
MPARPAQSSHQSHRHLWQRHHEDHRRLRGGQIVARIEVKGIQVSIMNDQAHDYISLTDIARFKNSAHSDDLIRNWLRNRNTIEFLGIWEQLNNPGFNPVEFDGFRKLAGLNSFTLTPSQWIEKTHAIGIISKPGRYGGTYAHQDIAFEFASWVSVEFKLYLIKEFQRLKEEEYQQIGWDIKRNLARINYRIQTDAVQKNLIPPELSKSQINFVYASEADVLNVALFGKTARQWREENPGEKGNIRDTANAAQLVCLSNLETLNAHFIQEKIPQTERLQRLNKIAIEQMLILTHDNTVKKLEKGE